MTHNAFHTNLNVKQNPLSRLKLSSSIQVVGFTITILFSFVQYIRGDAATRVDNLYFLVVGLMVTLLVSTVVSQVERGTIDESVNSIRQELSDISEQIGLKFNSVADCLYVGRANVAMITLLAELRKAEHVRDTLLVSGIDHNSVLFSVYSDKSLQEIRQGVREFVERGNRWSGIVSERFSFHQDVQLYDFASEMQRQFPGHFACRITKHEYPAINLTLLEYGNVGGRIKKRAYFGWGHFSTEPNGHVFSSEDDILIDMFEKYWAELEKDSVSVGSSAYNCSPSMLAGDWCGVSYYRRDSTESSSEQAIEVRDIALISISFDGRNVSVGGTLYNKLGYEIGYFESVAAEMKGNRLYFCGERVAGTGAANTGQAELNWLVATHYDFIADGSQYTGVIHEKISDRNPQVLGKKINVTPMTKEEAGRFAVSQASQIFHGRGLIPA